MTIENFLFTFFFVNALVVMVAALIGTWRIVLTINVGIALYTLAKCLIGPDGTVIVTLVPVLSGVGGICVSFLVFDVMQKRADRKVR